MNAKNIFLITICFLASVGVKAQYNQYNLQNYVNPDYQRQSLDFTANGNLSQRYSVYDRELQSYTKDKHKGIQGGTSINYFRIKNSLKTQNKMSGGLRFSGYSYDQNTDTELPLVSSQQKKSDWFSLSADFSHAGYYYGREKRFFVFSPDASFSYLKNKEKINNSQPAYQQNYERKRMQSNLFVSMDLGIGKGRIEQVGDAKKAIYILQGLQKQGVLRKTLSEDEITELAELITKMKNKRQFDHRIRLIDEISSIDSLFVKNSFADHQTKYYTALYDNWLYAGEERASGNRFAVGINPHWNHKKNRSKTVYSGEIMSESGDTTKTTLWGAGIFLSFESEKPINIYWQRSFSARVNVGWAKDSSPEEKKDGLLNYLDVRYGFSYYPNSRTSFDLYLSENISHDTVYYPDYFISSNTGLNFNVYYYFSPQLRLDATFSSWYVYRFSKNDYKDTDFNNSLSLNFTYSFY